MMNAGFKKFVFNLGATLYDTFTSQETWWNHCQKLSPEGEAFDSILDVGCGPGISAFALEDLHPDARIVGLDVAEKMIERAQREKRDRGSSVNFIIGNAERLPFPANRFDFVTGHSFLYLLDDAELVLQDIRRVLKPGGHIAFLEPRANPGLNWFFPSLGKGPRFFSTMIGWQIFSAMSGRFTRDDVLELLEQTGFTDVDTSVTLDGLGWMLRGRTDRG